MLASPALRFSDQAYSSFSSVGDAFSHLPYASKSSHTTDSEDLRPVAVAGAAQTVEKCLALKRSSLKSLFRGYAMYFDAGFCAQMLKQIDVLLDYDEWMDGDKLPSENSFRALLRGIVHLKPQKRPALGLTSGGNMLAMWSNETSKVSLEFIPGDLITWTATRRVSGPADQMASRTATVRLPAALEGFGVRDAIDGA